jgi:hypothetical protein
VKFALYPSFFFQQVFYHRSPSLFALLCFRGGQGDDSDKPLWPASEWASAMDMEALAMAVASTDARVVACRTASQAGEQAETKGVANVNKKA